MVLGFAAGTIFHELGQFVGAGIVGLPATHNALGASFIEIDGAERRDQGGAGV